MRRRVWMPFSSPSGYRRAVHPHYDERPVLADDHAARHHRWHDAAGGEVEIHGTSLNITGGSSLVRGLAIHIRVGQAGVGAIRLTDQRRQS